MNDYAERIAPATIKLTRQLPIPPEQVWPYLAEAEQRARWFCGGLTETSVGGRIIFEFDHRCISKKTPRNKEWDKTMEFEGEILIYDPPNRIAFTWPEPSGPTTEVDISLVAKDGGTELTLVHSRMPDDKYRLDVSGGWHAHLDLLVDLASGREARDFWVHYEALEDEYRAMEVS